MIYRHAPLLQRVNKGGAQPELASNIHELNCIEEKKSAINCDIQF